MENKSNSLTRWLGLTVVPGIFFGAIAIGPPGGTHHQAISSPAAATYRLPSYDHADPQHSEPVGEFIRLANPESGTASTMRSLSYRGK
jgi:hypothetical protein